MSLLDDYAEYESVAQSKSLRQREYILDEQETHLATSPSTKNKFTGLEEGYVTTTLDAVDAPIFSLDRVQFQVPNKIIALAVANDILVLVIEGAKILRINLLEAHNIIEADIPVKATDLKACTVFLDPSGRHLLISTPQGECFYYFEGWERARHLPKFKNMEVTAVAWNQQVNLASMTTRTILVGTHDGCIYETELKPGGDLGKSKRSDIGLKKVGELPVRERITGLTMEPFPSRLKQHLVLVATGTRLYQIIGAADLAAESGDKAPVFTQLFSEALSNPNFQEIPGIPGPGCLAMYRKGRDSENDGTPRSATSFAWLTSMGVFFGNLSYGAQESGDNAVENASLLPYPSEAQDSLDADEILLEKPSSIALTEFHIIIQYSDHIAAINMLSCETSINQHVITPAQEPLQALVADTTKGTYWLFSPSNIYEVVVTDEDRDVWQIFLSRRQFDAALQRCYNDAQKDKVLREKANYYLNQGDLVNAAKSFACTSVSFEEAVLKFIDKNDTVALKCYLLAKLDTMKRRDKIQMTLLVMWLIDIYLGLLNNNSNSNSDPRSSNNNNNNNNSHESLQGQTQNANTRKSLLIPTEHSTSSSDSTDNDKEREDTEKELYAFVEKYMKNTAPDTTYQLAESHGNNQFWLHYATLRGDYGKVIEYRMENEEYIQALQVLGRYGTPDMLYKYAPSLMHVQPTELVDILMRQPNLTPSRLIPALMRYDGSSADSTEQNQAIRYLRFCTQKQMCRDPVVYNYYLTLLIKESTVHDESDLMSFLTTYGKDMLYDPDYALRMCKRYGRIQSCVHLYSLLKLHEDAVDLALKHDDIELAQIHAEKPQEDDKLCKRLWLKIAQHVIKKTNSATEVMELVRRSNRLGVEDILPFFPDFTRVDDFKDDICDALENYEDQIQDLRSEMDEATRTADAMQRDMAGLKNRFAILSAEEVCQICDQPLWLRQFYVFPCQHSFHADCLTRKIVSTCNRVQRRRIHELQDQSVEVMKQRRQLRLTPLTGKSKKGSNLESDDQLELQQRKIKKNLDAIVAAECVLCGEVMIKSIAEPFIGVDTAVEDSWAI